MKQSSLAFALTAAIPLVMSACGPSSHGDASGAGGDAAGVTSTSTGAVDVSTSVGSSMTTSGVTGASSSSGGDFNPAAHGPVPQVVSGGGKVLANPKVVAITYASDPVNTDLDAFLSQLAGSSYWSAVSAEYGVGALQVRPTLHMPGSPPTSANLQTFLGPLGQNTSGASPAWGSLDPETIYLFVVPQGTSLDADGASCCGAFDGFHEAATLPGGTVPYAFICQCSDINETTITTSHELVEAVTDPYVESGFGYYQADDDHAAWTLISSGEVADMCQFNEDAEYIPQGMTYYVARSWSNAAAKAGHDPCVPHVSSEPYFNSVPVEDDTITVSVWGQPTQTKGIKIPIGGSRTVEVDLFSDGPLAGPWTVSAVDAASLFGGAPHLAFTWDKTTGVNGDKLALTIKVLSQDPDAKGEPFWIESKYGGQDNLWMAVVGN